MKRRATQPGTPKLRQQTCYLHAAPKVPVSVFFSSASVLVAVDVCLGVVFAVLERVCLPPERLAFNIGNAALACSQYTAHLDTYCISTGPGADQTAQHIIRHSEQ